MTELDRLIDAIVATGLPPPEPRQLEAAINKDKPVRWSTNGKKSDRAGFCFVRQIDRILFASFGCMRSGIRENWSSKNKNDMDSTQWQAHLKRREELSKKLQEDAKFKASEAAIKAQGRWEKARPADDSQPYLLTKNVQPYRLRVEGENLLIPGYRFDDEAGSFTISTLETISPSGEKFLMKDGTKKGSFYEITNKEAPKDQLILCEGFATGASIFEATGISTLVCFDAGNLPTVAELIRAKYPDFKLIIAADDDWKNDINTGLVKAQEAALEVGGYLTFPRFPKDRGVKDTDFNDLARLSGIDVVRLQIESASLINPDAWEEPRPLPNDIPPVMAFDEDLLPEAFRPWVKDIAHRMQVPPDFSAVGAMVAISSLIGARVVIAPHQKDSFQVVPNLWGYIVGRPGVKKSPALSEVMKPLNKLEDIERERFKQEETIWGIDLELKTLQDTANKKALVKTIANDTEGARRLLEASLPPEKPSRRRFMVNDASVEVLQDILTTNRWGLLVYRDEIHSLLTSMDKQGQEQSRGFYLQGYDGNQGYTVDRIGRGKDLHCERVCLAMLGSTQPGKLQSYVRDAVNGGAGDDGLLQRFGLAVWPDNTVIWQRVDQYPDEDAKAKAMEVFSRLNNLPQDQQVRRFTNDAQEIYWTWLESLERELSGDELHPALVSHLAKYRKLIPALALIFKLVDKPESNDIGKEELLRSLAWGEYLRSHAERIYMAATIPETVGAKTLLKKIQAGKLSDRDGVLLERFTPREVANKNWSSLGSTQVVTKAADLLVEYGYLKSETVQSSDHLNRGRPSHCYLVNPDILRG
jgi:putative DNA primase/helicase